MVFGTYVGCVRRDDRLHEFLSGIVRDQLAVREHEPAFRAFRLDGSNEVYAYEEKHSSAKIICKFYGRRYGWDQDNAARTAHQEYESLQRLRGFDLVGSPHHVIRPAQSDREWPNRGLRRRLPLLRPTRRPAQEKRTDRSLGRRRVAVVTGALARPSGHVAGPAGLVARRRHSRQHPVRTRPGRRRHRLGTDEARRQDVRRRAGGGRNSARIHDP